MNNRSGLAMAVFFCLAFCTRVHGETDTLEWEKVSSGFLFGERNADPASAISATPSVALPVAPILFATNHKRESIHSITPPPLTSLEHEWGVRAVGPGQIIGGLLVLAAYAKTLLLISNLIYGPLPWELYVLLTIPGILVCRPIGGEIGRKIGRLLGRRKDRQIRKAYLAAKAEEWSSQLSRPLPDPKEVLSEDRVVADTKKSSHSDAAEHRFKL